MGNIEISSAIIGGAKPDITQDCAPHPDTCEVGCGPARTQDCGATDTCR